MDPLDDQVRALLEPPVHERLDPDGDLGGLLPEPEEDRLTLLDRHPQVLALYPVGALVEYGEQIWAYGAPEDLPDRVRPDDALDVEAPRHVGGEGAGPYPGGPADEHDYRLGRLPQDAPLVEPAHDDGVLLDELVADPGEDLLLLDRVELLGQQLGANLARYLVRKLGLGTRLR